MNDIMTSKGFRITAFVLGGLILYFIGFAAGMTVGVNKERHFKNRNEHFQGMFAPRPGMARDGMPFGQPPLMPAHGAFGKVISVAWPSIVISMPDESEQEVIACDATSIRTRRGTGAPDDIVVGSDVAVFGSPNHDGQIEAQLIRILVTAQ